MSRQTAELPLELQSAPEAATHASTAPAHARANDWKSIVWPMLVPAAALIALAIHFLLPNRGLNPTSHSYPIILISILTLALLLPIIPPLRRGLRHRSRFLAAATLVLALWELITIKLNWLPLIYFPPPETVFQTLIDDRGQLWNSTWHSLSLLLSGYFLGTIAGLISGISI